MDIVIIGAGLGGLAAANCLARKGHRVRVLERSNGLSEFGAGIQVTPNAVRMIYSWGLKEKFEEFVHVPPASVCRRFSSGKVLGRNFQNPDSEEKYGFPYWQIYRPDFQRLLAEGAAEAGVKVEYGNHVTQVDPEAGKIVLTEGIIVKGDLIICADGIHSHSRKLIKGNEDVNPVPFKESNYRAMVPRSSMMSDPETAALMTSNDTQSFLGPGRALIGYPISAGQLFNVAITVPRPSSAPIGNWNQPGDLHELRELFADFCPLVQKLIGLVAECAKWTIAELPLLKTWSSHSGRTILLGDAAHAMSPHAAQGSAMAIEDAAVLGECLSHFPSAHDLPRALAAYEAIRRPRVERVAEIARGNGALWALPDGPEQELRDKRFRDVMEAHEKERSDLGGSAAGSKGKPKPDMYSKWPQPEVLMWLYGFDAVAEAKGYLDNL